MSVHHVRLTVLMLAVVAAVLLAGTGRHSAGAVASDISQPVLSARAADAPSASTHTYENPPTGCLGSGLDLLSVSGYPNPGNLYPEGLVAKGTTVRLIGTAEHHQRAANCNTVFSTLPFTWTGSFEDSNGVVSDITPHLVGSDALTPTLNADLVGTYRVKVRLPWNNIAEFNFTTLDSGDRWVNIGPDGSSRQATGRVNALAFDPTNAATLYAASAQGGVWKSTNAGAAWRPLMDNKGLPSLAIGALAVAPNGWVYAGTGEINQRGFPGDGDARRPGNGIYRSVDGGNTWLPTGTGGAGCAIPAASTYEQAITRILIDPNNAATLYVAADAGVFRSTDGGACWTSIQNNLPGGIADDIILNSLGLYAAPRTGNFSTAGVWYTSNPGLTPPTWMRLSAPPSTCPNPTRATLARGAGASLYVYASFGCGSRQNPPESVQVLASGNGGSSWLALPVINSSVDTEMRQVNYDLALVVDPSSPSRIFQGVVNVWSYTLPNGPWIKWNGPNDNTPNSQGGLNIHGDIHALLFDPNSPNLLYSGNDGGVYRFDVSGNPAVASTNWTPLNNQLVISQFRTLGFNPNWPGDVAGGLQDNATPRRLLTGRTWFGVPGNGGDGYWSQYDADFRYFNFGGSPVPSPLASTIYVNTNVPDDFDRYAPSISASISASTPILGRVNEFWTDPFRPSVMLATTPISGTDSVAGALYYATNVETSTSPNWTCIDPTPTNTTDNVSAVAFARIFPSGSGGVYYVGTGNGRIYVVDVLPGTVVNCGSGTSALRNFPPTPIYVGTMPIDGLAEDPNQPCVLYALSTSATGANRVLRLAATPTAGGCTAWSAAQAIGGGLNTTVYGQPALLHRWTMAVDPTSSSRIYVGSAAGLFVGELSGLTWGWTRTLDIPDTTVVDVKAPVNAAGPHGTLFAATFGRGVYERVQVSPSALSQANAKPTALSNEIRRCQLREVEDPSLRWRAAEVEVEYAYNGDQGDNVWVRPVLTAQGQTSPYFVREIQQVISGTHATNLQVLYEAADAPPGVTTEGLRVEMFPQGGGSFLSHECHASKTWRRDDARVLEVRAEDLVAEGGTGTALVPVQISLSNGAMETRQTPFSVVITQGLSITLEAPRVRTEHDELRVLHVWRKLGHEETSTSPSFTFTLNDDSTAIVSYIPLEARIFLPSVQR